ncbi:hypothetical protein EXIGLDRAFT_775738 [Exidia glandulosa HHB12029]|uniref:Zn(2)-C6 fungal-type domain-containing protein n=1 Tax=Exidia glandulosa HHB12029 TaxID=1314781 RepID=A0A165DS98_EXIGL|nr:hypothetical protein EXIGLDRAFT_775738 [Exidia glandulosa HHB12029]
MSSTQGNDSGGQRRRSVQPSGFSFTQPLSPDMFDPASGLGPRANASIACNSCRARKIKCSGERPSCANCALYRVQCEYVSGRARSVPPKGGVRKTPEGSSSTTTTGVKGEVSSSKSGPSSPPSFISWRLETPKQNAVNQSTAPSVATSPAYNAASTYPFDPRLYPPPHPLAHYASLPPTSFPVPPSFHPMQAMPQYSQLAYELGTGTLDPNTFDYAVEGDVSEERRIKDQYQYYCGPGA